MEIKVIENKKNKLVFELKGQSHGFCNILKDQLWKDSHVKVAAYKVEHPLVGIPTFIVETDGSESPKNALLGAIKKLDSVADKLKKELAKELK